METRELRIDEEFKNLIPPLSKEEFEQLKQNIIADGCRDSLVVWNGTIVDGHNRYQICNENNIRFSTVEKDFETREDVVIWICQNQRGRRNITKEQTDYLMGKEYEATKKKWGDFGRINKSPSADKRHLVSDKPKGRTRELIGEKYGIGKTAVMSNIDFSKGIDVIAESSPLAKQKILSGQSNVAKKTIQEIPQKSQDEVEAIVKQIETDTYKRVRSKKSVSDKQTKEEVSFNIENQKEVAKEEEKECLKCKQMLPLTYFYSGKKLCKSCHNSSYKTLKDFRGNPYLIAEEYKHLKEEDIIGELYNVDREIRYDIQDLIHEFHVNFTTYAQNLETILEQHKDLLKDVENNKKIMVELSEAVATMSNMKGKYSYEQL